MQRLEKSDLKRSPGLRAAAVALAAAAGLSGCASYDRNHFIVGSVPDDYRTRHPIVVAQADTAEDIVVPANAGELSYRDRAVVLSFASRFRQAGAASMAILVPSGSPNESAARRLAHQAVQVLGERGIHASQIAIQHYAAASHGDAATLRLVFSGMKAATNKPCGQWSEDLMDTSENRNYANFGCATQQNLAAMVANPADLLGPRGESEIDAPRRTNVINTWREDGAGDLPGLFE